MLYCIYVCVIGSCMVRASMHNRCNLFYLFTFYLCDFFLHFIESKVDIQIFFLSSAFFILYYLNGQYVWVRLFSSLFSFICLFIVRWFLFTLFLWFLLYFYWLNTPSIYATAINICAENPTHEITVLFFLSQIKQNKIGYLFRKEKKNLDKIYIIVGLHHDCKFCDISTTKNPILLRFTMKSYK